MLYERTVRSCFENSIKSLIDNLDEIIDYQNESLSKDLRDETQTLSECDILKLAMDSVLAKRIEKKFQLKIHLSFNKENGLVQLQPPVDEWLADIT